MIPKAKDLAVANWEKQINYGPGELWMLKLNKKFVGTIHYKMRTYPDKVRVFAYLPGGGTSEKAVDEKLVTTNPGVFDPKDYHTDWEECMQQVLNKMFK